MIKKFTDNVQRLYNEIVIKQTDVAPNTMEDLLNVLNCKEAQPLQVKKEDMHTCIVYYNVSVTLANDFSEMDIAYNSDCKTALGNVAYCDVQQLSEFILALERDMPKWNHIWTAYANMQKELVKINSREESLMQQFHKDWMRVRWMSDEKLIEKLYVKYYNLQACRLCLENENPLWENKTTKEDILDECRIMHIEPPVEQWNIVLDDFVDGCKQERDERDRLREEVLRKNAKTIRLMNMKQLKLEALINSVEFNEGFEVTMEPYMTESEISLFSSGIYLFPRLYFTIQFKIGYAMTSYKVHMNNVDGCALTIKNTINRINDLIPELNNALANDGEQYYVFCDCINVDYSEPLWISYNSDDGHICRCINVSSCGVLTKINDAFRDLYSVRK